MRLDPKTRAFEICWQKIQAGSGLEQALEIYPQWAEELRPLLEAAQAARWFGTAIRVPEAAQGRSKAIFLQAAQRAQTRPGPFSLRLSLVLLVILLLVAAGAATAVVFSARAMPGERLYPVKLFTQRARLHLVRDPLQRLEWQRRYDRERIEEVEALILQRQQAENEMEAEALPLLRVDFAGGLAQAQGQEWLVGGIPVQVPEDARLVGQVKSGIVVDVRGLLRPDGIVLAQAIQAREFEITGKLQNMDTDRWIIDGIAVQVTPDTTINGSPAPGSQVLVKAFLLLDGSLQARLIEAGSINDIN